MMVVVKQSSRHKMWTEITRRKYEREGQRYASDLTDAEWGLIEPHMPAVKRLGRPRETELRTVLDAILYIARTGCQWRMLPKDFPPFTTVQGYFYDWRDDGLFEKINFELLMRSGISRGPAVSGGCCRRTFLRLQLCKGISTTGEMTACLRRSILSCCCKRAKRRVGNRARRRGSSTVNRPRPPRAVGRVVTM